MFPIVEYETGGQIYDQSDGNFAWKWTRKISIDLRWVASAQPYGDPVATNVTLCVGGLGDPIVINVEYSDFMRDWVRAKGL